MIQFVVYKNVIVFSFFFLFSLSEIKAQSQEKLYALSLLSFARNTNWPALSSKKNFTIGIWEYLPLVGEMNELIKTRNVNGKNIEVKAIANLSELAGCDILFFPSYKYKLFPKVVETTRNAPILIVTNKQDLAKNGGCIDIILTNGKLNYEINSQNIEGRGMKVTNALKNMGTVVTDAQ